MPQAHPGPTAGGERLALLDALRGFALAGVLLVNLGSFTLYFHLSPEQRAALPTAGFDAWARPVLYALATGKFITLFSLLFGLGFSVQLMRAEARGASARAAYVRRLGVLLAIGLVHGFLLWWGDVLRQYAVLGLGLLLFRRATPRVLLWTGLGLAVVAPVLLRPLADALVAALLPGLSTPAEANARALAAFSGGSYAAVVRTNPWYEGLFLVRHWSEPLFIFGRFLLGAWAGRTLLLHRPLEHRGRLVRLCAGGLSLGLAGSVVGLLRASGRLAPGVAVLEGAGGRALSDLVDASASLALGAGYAAGFALLFLRPAWRARLVHLAPVGRMALTHYLTQTVVALGLFYGIGLGLGPAWGLPGWLLAWASIFGAQVVLSRLWLARFRFGPVEWVWRSLTYGRAQPLRLEAAGGPATPGPDGGGSSRVRTDAED